MHLGETCRRATGNGSDIAGFERVSRRGTMEGALEGTMEGTMEGTYRGVGHGMLTCP